MRDLSKHKGRHSPVMMCTHTPHHGDVQRHDSQKKKKKARTQTLMQHPPAQCGFVHAPVVLRSVHTHVHNSHQCKCVERVARVRVWETCTHAQEQHFAPAPPRNQKHTSPSRPRVSIVHAAWVVAPATEVLPAGQSDAEIKRAPRVRQANTQPTTRMHHVQKTGSLETQLTLKTEPVHPARAAPVAEEYVPAGQAATEHQGLVQEKRASKRE